MKKILSLILVLILCTSLMALTVSAAGSGSLSASVDKAEVAAGETVTVTVKLNSNPGIAYLKLTPSSTATRTSFSGSGLSWTIGSSAVFAAPTNNTYTGSILTLTYTAPDAVGTYNVSFSVQAWDENEEAVSFNAPSVSFEVVCDHNYVKDDAASSDATCGKDGKLVEVCSKCGDVKETVLPATGKHNYVKDDAASSDATCGKDGKLVEVCSVCGDTKTTTLPATGNHNNGTYTKIDGNDKQHKVSCSVCGKEDELENHSWDNGTEKTPATCGDPGEKIFTCTKCGYEKSEEIPATGKHTWGKWTKVDDDVHEHVCSVCGASEEDEHNWDSGKVTVKPTEEKDGERTYTCADCGATKTEVEKWKDNVPNTGDITPQITMYAVALVVMMGAVALVFKRKTAK